MTYLVGIDLGSTNLKAILYDAEGRAVAQGSRPTQLTRPRADHPDWAEWQPEQIWDGVRQSLRDAVAGVDDPRQIRGVAVTGMGMDGLPMTDDGLWHYPFIAWHCPRTADQQQWWLENIGTERQFSISGTQIWRFNTALRLLWMMEHEPEILARADRWVLIEDFINYRLCGRFATDYSMASTTLLFDQRRRQWSEELVERANLDGSLLCEPLPAGTVLGEVHGQAAAETHLPEGTPVVLGGHDYCCGMLPVGAHKPGTVLDVTGTWEMVAVALDEPVLTPEVARMGPFVDSHVARGKWCAMGGAVAADMLEWFRREVATAEQSDDSIWDALIASAEASPPGAQGVMFLPHFSGGSCPEVDADSKGAFVGLRNVATRGDLFRAMIEVLDYQFLDIVRAYERGLHIRPDKIVAIGGAINNRFWMQNKADVTGIPIEVPEIDEAVPLGAALLAGIGTGVYANEEDAFHRVYRGGTTYTPNDEQHRQYAEWYKTWSLIYPALRDVNRRL